MNKFWEHHLYPTFDPGVYLAWKPQQVNLALAGVPSYDSAKAAVA